MLALVNGRILTREGLFIDSGTVILDNGKILGVGQRVEIPSECRAIDLGGKMVTPGIIDAHVHIGIGEEGIGFEGEDYNEMNDPVTPHLRAIDAINPEEEGVKDAVKGGITTVMTGPGSANVLGGQTVVMKTFGTRMDQMILKAPAGIKAAFGENPKRVYSEQKKSPQTRMATAALLRETLIRAKKYLEKTKAADGSSDKLPDYDMKYEALMDVLEGNLPLKVHAHRADDILTAIRIADEFGIKITIEHCTEGHKIANELASRGIPAIVGPTMSSRVKVELRGRSFETPAVLVRHGVKVALMTDHPVIPIQFLPICAGLAVREGMPEAEAFKALTINPAEILGVSDRVGSLEPGKDADVVIWSGHPFETMSSPEMVIVDGEIVSGELADK